MQNIAMTALNDSLFEDRALRTQMWKLILRKFAVGTHPPELQCELYDMQADPGETRSLACSADHRETRIDLARQLQACGSEQQDALAVELATNSLQRLESAS
jgi:arylsulfatase A-like enzyme